MGYKVREFFKLVLQDTILKPVEWYRRVQTATQYTEICNAYFKKAATFFKGV